MATYMEKSAGDALAALANLAAPQCTVIRQGNRFLSPAVDVVCGDILVLSTGDSIAADIRVIEGADLKTSEAILTGEPNDVKKRIIATNAASPFADNLCFHPQ